MKDSAVNPLIDLPNDLEEFLERYVYVIEGDQISDLALPQHASTMKKNEFIGLTRGVWISIEVRDGRSGELREKRVQANKYWMNDAARLVVRGESYVPGGGRIVDGGDGLEYINTFTFPDHKGGDTKLAQLFFDHLKFLIPEEDRLNMFVSFLAHIVQYPQERPKFVPLLIARKHGMGRGWIVNMMNEVLGYWNCSTMDIQDLSEGAFQDPMHRRLFVAIHECRTKDGRYEIDDRIRSKLTESRLSLNLKYGKKLPNEQVYCRVVAMSNHDDALIIPLDDRRIWVHGSTGEPKSEDYYTELYDWIPEGAPHVFSALMEYDLDDFNSGMRAPMTPEKQIMQTFAQSEEADIVLDLINHHLPEGLDVMTFAQVKRAVDSFADWSVFNDVTTARLSYILREHCDVYGSGAEDGKLKWKGNPLRAWIMRNPDQWRDKNNADIRKQLDKTEEWLEKINPGLNPFKDDEDDNHDDIL